MMEGRTELERIVGVLRDILRSGDHAKVELEILNGYIKRFEVDTLDTRNRRTENLSVGENPSTP